MLVASWAPSSPLADPVATFFAKEGLRGGRLLATAVFLPVLFALVTYAWRPIADSLGWLLEPLGRGALLAYALHLFFAIGANAWWPHVPGYDLDDPLSNTAAHVLVIALLWLMVAGWADRRRVGNSLCAWWSARVVWLSHCSPRQRTGLNERPARSESGLLATS
jgi:hypothetical protein